MLSKKNNVITSSFRMTGFNVESGLRWEQGWRQGGLLERPLQVREMPD